MKTRYGTFVAIGLAIIMSGCSMMEIRQELLGIYSPNDVINAEKKYTHQCDVSGDIAFKKALEILKEMKAEVIKKDARQYLIVAIRFDRSFGPCINTTAVSILIRPTGNSSSEILVTSGNYNLGEYVSMKLFSGISTL